MAPSNALGGDLRRGAVFVAGKIEASRGQAAALTRTLVAIGPVSPTPST